eukprot:Phypoly_transcript_10080.p1 GENE.Phypoly_transcript_10080~~Phypoly_transcript_10080.p1  ORF type:complete len:401 (+),score=76.55 Phypoly_transcript_10080:70-1203(+)
MGNSTNLFNDINTAKGSVVAASNAILTNTAHLSTAAKDFVTIVEKMEQRAKELDEKEVQIKKKEEEVAKKHKELDEKKVKLDERDYGLNLREQKVAEQEKLWGELKKMMEPAGSQESTTIITTTTAANSRSPRDRRSMSVSSDLPALFKRSEVVSSPEPPVLFKRSEVIEPPHPQHVKREVAPEPPHVYHHPHPNLKRESPTPEAVTIPNSLLTAASESFLTWLPVRTFSLVYKATRDGFSKVDFHRICDNKGPTVTLILTDKGHLFGGYAPISWGRTFEGYDTHPECFLFTLSNPHNIPPTQYKLRQGNAYGLRNGQHVSFGWCGDIRIADENAHLTTDSCSNFARSFIDTTGKGNATFTGEHKFKVLEIEVYLVM